MNTRRIAWSIVGLLSLSAAARGGAVLELVPSNPGPYFGGEALSVDLWLQSDLDRDIDVTVIQLDFQDTHPALGLDHEFRFDPAFYIPLPGGFHYTIQPDLPIPVVAFTPLILLPPEWFVQLPATGRLHVGSIGVHLPEIVGSYAIDALNADETNLFQGGALINVGGAYWLARDGALRGESLEFHIVPEPATIVLLAVGVLMLSRKRYRMIGGSSCTPSDEPVRDFAGDPLGSAPFGMIPLSCILVTAVSASILYAQPLSVPSQRVVSTVDSGPVSAVTAGAVPVVVFSQNIIAPTAPWVRLQFGQVQLSGSSQQGNASFLRITSLQDGAVQSLGSAAFGPDRC